VERQECKAFPHFSNYEITFEDVTIAFSVTIIDFLHLMVTLYIVDLDLTSITMNLFGNICIVLLSNHIQ